MVIAVQGWRGGHGNSNTLRVFFLLEHGANAVTDLASSQELRWTSILLKGRIRGENLFGNDIM
jgi:hypothetical protein